MSRLSDVIAEVIELAFGPDGQMDVNAAVTTALGLIDEEDGEVLKREAMFKRIKDASTRAKRSLEKIEVAQRVLPFDLRPAHALDVDERSVKLTTELSQLEFRRIIEIRRKQVADDTAYLDALQKAYRAVEPIWASHPDLTFGAVCEIYGRGAEPERSAS